MRQYDVLSLRNKCPDSRPWFTINFAKPHWTFFKNTINCQKIESVHFQFFITLSVSASQHLSYMSFSTRLVARNNMIAITLNTHKQNVSHRKKCLSSIGRHLQLKTKLFVYCSRFRVFAVARYHLWICFFLYYSLRCCSVNIWLIQICAMKFLATMPFSWCESWFFVFYAIHSLHCYLGHFLCDSFSLGKQFRI